MIRAEIEAIVLDAIRVANLSRDPGEQLEVGLSARIFGRGSPLDSMGLVALLLDVEEALRAAGMPLTLTDDRAMSQTRSPFRSVPALVDYVELLCGEGPCRPNATS
jgi:acyl carrier protein